MIHEQEFICWHANQDENDGKEINATTIRSAAKRALNIWRHEDTQGVNGNKITVFVRDEARRVHRVIITTELETRPPETFQ